jgi:hypothetical protein
MGYAAAQVRWGDVATWVGGIATAVALLLTLLLLRITRQEQRDARAEQRRAQASLVSAWSDRVGPTLSDGLQTVTVKLQNSSHEPIYGVRIAVGARWSRDSVRYEELDIIYIVPPKSADEHEVSLELDRAPDGSYEPSPPVEVIFYDATRGGLWLRDRFGRLAELKDKESVPVAEHFFKKPKGISPRWPAPTLMQTGRPAR